ncbi:MAG: class I SAM-dependent methyltransferase [Marinifilaceae bacterium]
MNTDKQNIENRKSWNTNSADWDNYMGESGNDWHKELVAPDTERLLNLQKGDNLLDIGCGNGLFSRRMAKRGVKVRAFDFSQLNIENARKYDCHNIDYEILDATNNGDLNKLHDRRYNGIVSNMVLMDMPEIETLFSHIRDLLEENGTFVFSIQHPCFNSEYVEQESNNSLLLRDYIHPSTSKGIAIPTQKVEQYYFHRPISYYLNLGIDNGLVVNGFVEPTFDNEKKFEMYSNKFPPILIIRMIKLK